MTTSLVQRLKAQLEDIERQMGELLDCSTIKTFRNDPYSRVVIMHPYYWGTTDEGQQRLQLSLKRNFSVWFEQFNLLFTNAPAEIERQIKETERFVSGWINKESTWDVPPAITSAKEVFAANIKPFYDLLRMVEEAGIKEFILLPDTNALIMAPAFNDYTEIAGQQRFSVVLVPTVLAELDKLKVIHRDNDFRAKVNSVIKRIKGLRQQGSLLNGVTVNKTITVRMVAQEPDFSHTLGWLDADNNDDRVIASALEIQRAHHNQVVILVTSDINLQNKAEMANLPFAEPPEPEEQTTEKDTPPCQ